MAVPSVQIDLWGTRRLHLQLGLKSRNLSYELMLLNLGALVAMLLKQYSLVAMLIASEPRRWLKQASPALVVCAHLSSCPFSRLGTPSIAIFSGRTTYVFCCEASSNSAIRVRPVKELVRFSGGQKPCGARPPFWRCRRLSIRTGDFAQHWLQAVRAGDCLECLG